MERHRSASRLAAIARLLVGAWAAVSLSAIPATALELRGAGGRVGYTSPDLGEGATELGVHADLADPGTPLTLQPSLLYWRSDELRDINPNLDVAYAIGRSPSLRPYVGAGLGLNFLDDDRPRGARTDADMNLLGGLRFPGEGHELFLEARHTMSDVSRTAVVAGITFGSR